MGQQVAVPEVTEHLNVWLHIRTEGSGGDEATTPSAYINSRAAIGSRDSPGIHYDAILHPITVSIATIFEFHRD
jgi:hypothetical protein